MKSTESALQPLKKIVNLEPSTLQVTWVMNNICSNACTYCLPSLYAGTNHNYDWLNAKEFIRTVINRYKSSHWSVSGGEPTMSPFFPEFIRMIKDSGNTVGITTNGVKPVKYMEKIAHDLNYIAYSYHPEYTNDQEFIEKVLTTNPISTSPVRVMMHADPKLWDKSKALIKRLSKNPTISYESVKVTPYKGVAKYAFDYSPEQLEWFGDIKSSQFGRMETQVDSSPAMKALLIDENDTAYDTDNISPVEWINQGLTNFNGWKCNIGLESLFIGTTGHIERGNCIVGGIIGHLDNPQEVQWPTKAVTCNVDICHCATDMFISKSKLHSELK